MQLQLIYDEIAEKNQEAKEIKREYKDALKNANEYEETAEKLKEIREKKKQIESITQDRMGARWEKLESIKTELKTKKEMMTDVAMTDLMAGKTVSIKDKFDNEYEPVYSIRFKKIG